MAITNFWHCENITDQVVKSHRFQTLITKTRLVVSDFRIPNRGHVGGDILDHNCNSCTEQNVGLIGKYAEVFGITWMIDGETIFRMPLVNIPVMCGDVPPAVVDIHDCTGHMVEGDNKDAEYLAEVMEYELKNHDTYKKCTDMFYFYGAGNVHKSGKRLCALYPRDYVFHGGKHIISLFFSGVEKLPSIKVSMFLLIS